MNSQTAANLVEVTSVVRDVRVSLKYATADNFMRKAIYPANAHCLLLKPVAERLALAAAALRADGYRLILYDCYRPASLQWELWKVMPVPGYVANPTKGSMHSRGTAVDLSLLGRDGGEIEMPTPFDVFGPAAHHGYPGGTAASRANRDRLLRAMTGAGFETNDKEWWHYQWPMNPVPPLLDVPFDDLADAVATLHLP